MTAVTTHAERGVNTLSAFEVVPTSLRIDDEQLLAAAQNFGGTQEVASRKYLLAGGYAVNDHKVSRHRSVSIICNLDRTESDVIQRHVMHRAAIKGEPMISRRGAHAAA